MIKPIFLLLGGNKLNYGILRKFQKNGYLVYIIDWNEHPQITGDRHYKIDVKDAELIIWTLKKDGVWDRVAFAYSSIDLAVVSVTYLNRMIGLATISDRGLNYVSSKSMMTRKWSEAGLLNRFSNVFTAYNEKIKLLNEKMKIIVKPDNSASSRGITILERNSRQEQIEEAFDKAYDEATDGLVLVEEFVEGTEFTVDMLGDNDGNVCVYGISRKSHTKHVINNRIAVKLHYNSVSSILQSKIALYGMKCYNALEFSNSLGHLEIILKNDGTLSPVEIGARSSGYIASDLVDIVSGADYLGDLMRVHKGMLVMNGLHLQKDRSSLFFFYDFPESVVLNKECTILDFCDASINSRYNDRSNIVEGRIFSTIDSDNARFGYEILEGPKTVLTIQHIKKAEAKMLSYMFGMSI